MHWLMLALAIGAMAVAVKTSSPLIMGICLLVALVFLVAWVLGLYAARAGARSRDETAMIDPVELRRLREQAQARKVAAASQSEPPPSA